MSKLSQFFTASRVATLWLYIMSSLFLAACGGGGGASSAGGGSPSVPPVAPPPPVSPPPPPPVGGNDTVEQVLQSFGIDTAESPRHDIDGDDLPEDYAPLGSTPTINKFSELLVFGSGLEGSPLSSRMPVVNIVPQTNNQYSSEVLSDKSIENTPWFEDLRIPRAAVAVDVDADGLEEIVIAYQETGEPVNVVVMQDESDGFSISAPVFADLADRDQLFLASGDFNGDGRVDVVVGLVTYGADSSLVLLQNVQGVLTLNGQQITLPGSGGVETHLAMASGSLDYDVASELGIVVNEIGGELTDGRGGAGDITDGDARYFLLDDANSDFALLRSGAVDVDFGSGVARAVVADISLGDVDGDSVDEIVLGGLDEMGRGDSLDGGEPDYLLQVLDDAKRGFSVLAGNRIGSGAAELRPNASGASHWLMYLHVITADVDGDGAKEIVSNQFVYEDLREAPGSLVRFDDGDGPVEIPANQFINAGEAGAAGNYFFSWATSDMIAADVTSDKRENVVILSEAQSEVIVWGDDQIDGFKEMHVRDLASNGTNTRSVALAPDVELDNESMALEFSSGGYRYALTEPVIIAAIAASPCASDLGQDLSSCRTAFGQAVSESGSRTDGWSLSLGASAGFAGNVPILGATEAVLNTQSTLRQYTTSAYTVTKSILRETGPIEDSVIFYTVPMDIYTYTVLSHPNPDLVGENIEVRLPREPITVMTPRETYNANVASGAFKVDERIFSHTEGNHRSYPSAAMKNQLLSRFDGLESEAFDVGSGGGRTTVTISEFESTSRGRSFEFQSSLDLRTTNFGIVRGLSVGGGSDSAVEITRGSENIYQGTIGHIGSAFFPQDVYEIGLFAYIYDDAATEQVFEVLNYWVE